MTEQTSSTGPTVGVSAVGETGRGTSQAYTSAGGEVAVGKVLSTGEDKLVFNPAGTNYELILVAPGYAGPVHGPPVRGIIRVTARKVWTVPSGGNFIAPIFGPPRTIQGRVRSVESGRMVVHAGCQIWVDLPDNDIVYDLARGPIRVGGIVNVTALPGATFELAS
jgi:hypothetical protein